MDKRLESIMNNFDSMKIGLDDTFHFGCKQCGKCCIHREDILLNAKDLYNLSKALNLSPKQVVQQYCETYIGPDSRIPLVRLMPRGSVRRCPFLVNRKCSVHSLKPTVCAMFPIGRCIRLNRKTGPKHLQKLNIEYIHNNTSCGNNAEKHTVREWLSMFGIPIEDESFYTWHQTLLDVSDFVRKAEEKLSVETIEQIWGFIYVALYLCYNPEEAFLPQLQANSEKLLAALDSIPLK